MQGPQPTTVGRRPAEPDLRWPGMRSQYAWLPPHEDPPTVTGPGQVGVAFSAHEGLVYDVGGRVREVDTAPASVVVSGAEPITWRRVREHTEALEIYPDPALLAHYAGAAAYDVLPVAPWVGAQDGTVLAVGTLLRRAHAGGPTLTDVAGSTLAHLLARHLVVHYAGGRPERPAPGRLARATVDRVAEVVEARLHTTLSLDDLAAVAGYSPFHFSRAFRRTTGLTPHAYVTARRLDRARLLLWTTPTPVDRVAAAVGFTNLSHFRRLFQRHHGAPPSAFRAPRRREQDPTW